MQNFYRFTTDEGKEGICFVKAERYSENESDLVPYIMSVFWSEDEDLWDVYEMKTFCDDSSYIPKEDAKSKEYVVEKLKQQLFKVENIKDSKYKNDYKKYFEDCIKFVESIEVDE